MLERHESLRKWCTNQRPIAEKVQTLEISKQRAMPPIEVGGVRREVTRTVNKRAGELEREAVAAKTFMLAMNALTRPLHNGAYR